MAVVSGHLSIVLLEVGIDPLPWHKKDRWDDLEYSTETAVTASRCDVFAFSDYRIPGMTRRTRAAFTSSALLMACLCCGAEELAELGASQTMVCKSAIAIQMTRLKVVGCSREFPEACSHMYIGRFKKYAPAWCQCRWNPRLRGYIQSFTSGLLGRTAAGTAHAGCRLGSTCRKFIPRELFQRSESGGRSRRGAERSFPGLCRSSCSGRREANNHQTLSGTPNDLGPFSRRIDQGNNAAQGGR